MIFDIPLTNHLVLAVVLELGEDIFQRFTEDVGQHVEPAAVRHTDDDMFQPAPVATSDQVFKQGDG